MTPTAGHRCALCQQLGASTPRYRHDKDLPRHLWAVRHWVHPECQEAAARLRARRAAVLRAKKWEQAGQGILGGTATEEG